MVTVRLQGREQEVTQTKEPLNVHLMQLSSKESPNMFRVVVIILLISFLMMAAIVTTVAALGIALTIQQQSVAAFNTSTNEGVIIRIPI